MHSATLINSVTLPLTTISIAAVSSLLMLLPADWHHFIYFNWNAITQGDFWSLVSGHFIHADVSHWFWNCLAALIVGAFIEFRSRRLLLASLGAGLLSVNMLLVSPFSDVSVYCGLSGVLNSLLIVALWLFWRETQSRWVIITGILCTGKILIEILAQQSLLTQITWPPYAPAHLAGAIGGAVTVWCVGRKTRSYKTGSNFIKQDSTAISSTPLIPNVLLKAPDHQD